MNEWNIKSRAHACQGCAKGFDDKQTYHTLLFFEKHELQRLDVCDTCWKEQHAEGKGERKGFVSYWHGVYEVPPAAPPEPIQRETAETLLRRLMEANDPAHAAACFILAVMLERKRLLKVKEQFQRDGRRIYLYEQPRTGDLYTIPDPDLQLNQLEEVQRDVASLLENGFNRANPEVVAPAPAAAEPAPEPAASPAP